MGKKSAFSKSSPNYRRQSKNIDFRKIILIVCEGAKTEVNYFKDFKLPQLDIQNASGHNNDTLLDLAIKRKKEKPSRYYDEVWAVFDRDSSPEDKINSAITKADENSIRLAVSNECFELWYLLHFDYVNDGRTRIQYTDALKKKINPIKYKKQSLYETLNPKIEISIKNAKKLVSDEHNIQMKTKETSFLKRYPGIDFANTKPFTSVHDLVEVLQKEQNKLGGTQ